MWLRAILPLSVTRFLRVSRASCWSWRSFRSRFPRCGSRRGCGVGCAPSGPSGELRSIPRYSAHRDSSKRRPTTSRPGAADRRCSSRVRAFVPLLRLAGGDDQRTSYFAVDASGGARALALRGDHQRAWCLPVCWRRSLSSSTMRSSMSKGFCAACGRAVHGDEPDGSQSSSRPWPKPHSAPLCDTDHCLVGAACILHDGLAKAFFDPLAVSYLIALLASFVVAMTATPAMASVLWRRSPSTREPPVRGCNGGMKQRFRRTVDEPRGTLIATAAVVLVALVIWPFFGQSVLPSFSLLPQFDEKDVRITWKGVPGHVLSGDAPDRDARQ